MEFEFTPEQERVRQEIRDFCKEWIDEDLLDELEQRPGESAYDPKFYKKMGEKGYLGLQWPKEYGGSGYGHIEMAIFNEEMSYYNAPMGPYGQTIGVFGNSLVAFGTEKQKKQWLPGIASGDIRFCQGFSEPNAGSDLASLQIRAVADGDDFVINGQKIFTTNAEIADWVYLATRTDPAAPKHKGITMFVVDIHSPGITVRPLKNMAFGRNNEVFYEDVRVPRENMVGELNRGWYHIATTLDFERSGVGSYGAAKRLLEDLVRYAKETKVDGRPLSEDPIIRQKLAEMVVETEVGRLIAYRVAWMQQQHLIPGTEASMSKLFGSELLQRIANTGMQILGPYCQIRAGSKWAGLRGRIERLYKTSVLMTIAAGSSEIQRNIMATRGLGLPRA